MLRDFYYDIKAFLSNLHIFIPLAWKWRTWDACYTLDVFVELLKVNARIVRDSDRIVGSEKIYRRGMTMAGKLDRAYNNDVPPRIIRLLHIMYSFEKDSMFKKSDQYLNNKKYYDKLYDLAREHGNKIEKENKKEAWEYVHRYIDYIWD